MLRPLAGECLLNVLSERKPVWQNPKKRKLYKNKTGYSKKVESFSTKSAELLTKSLSQWLLVIFYLYVLNRFVV